MNNNGEYYYKMLGVESIRMEEDGATHNDTMYNTIAFLWNYCRLYGWQVLILSVLSGMAAFRREMSSNRIYHPDDNDIDKEKEEENKKKSNNRNDSSIVVTDNRDAILEELLDPLLEGAGRVCSGGPLSAILYAMLHYSPIDDNEEEEEDDKSSISKVDSSSSSCSEQNQPRLSVMFLAAQQWLNDNGAGEIHTSNTSSNNTNSDGVCWFLEVPCDVLIQVSEYLEGRDVLALGCANVWLHQTMLTPSNDTSTQLWYTLWKRDYPIFASSSNNNDIVSSLIERSFATITTCPSIICHHFITSSYLSPTAIVTNNNNNNNSEENRESMLDFYWKMGPAWINHICAGFCTTRKCLTGLHGHVLDITHFMHAHPGSLETLICHAGGKDASRYFEDVGHSKGARRMASTLSLLTSTDQNTCIKRRSHGTLTRIKVWMKQKEIQAIQKAEQQLSSSDDVLGNINIYYDVFQGKWFAWHLDYFMEPVFIPTPLL